MGVITVVSATRICKAAFGPSKELVNPIIASCLKAGKPKQVCESTLGDASLADKSRTSFFARSGGWHDCGTQGTPQILTYLPLATRIPAGVDQAKLRAAV